MKTKLPLLIITLLSMAISACAPKQAVSVHNDKSTVIGWNSDEGIYRLENSRYKIDFFKLANHFESQENKLFCGPASATIVLNTLRVRNGQIAPPHDKTVIKSGEMLFLPKGNWTPFYHRYTQNSIFLKSPKSRIEVLGKPVQHEADKLEKDFGFQIHQFQRLLNAHGLEAKLRIVDEKLSEKTIRDEIIANLKTANDYVIVNYKRTPLGQKGGGHISPIAAYHQPSDSFLILDVAPNKADWVWVNARLLIRAMRTFDTVENRGYVLVKESTAPVK